MTLTLPGSNQALRAGKLLCIGKNYARHAAEMKSTVPTEPVVFLKPATALLRDGGTVVLTLLALVSRDAGRTGEPRGESARGRHARQFRLISSGLSLVALRRGVNDGTRRRDGTQRVNDVVDLPVRCSRRWH